MTRRRDSGRSLADMLGDRTSRRPSVKSWYGSAFLPSVGGWALSIMRSRNDFGGCDESVMGGDGMEGAEAWTDPATYFSGRRNSPLGDAIVGEDASRGFVASPSSSSSDASSSATSTSKSSRRVSCAIRLGLGPSSSGGDSFSSVDMLVNGSKYHYFSLLLLPRTKSSRSGHHSSYHYFSLLLPPRMRFCLMARWFDMVRLDAGSFFIAIYRCFPFYYHYFPSFQLATSFHSRNHAVEPCAPSEGPRPSCSGGIDMCQ